jgi:hypothetical protein
MKNRLTNLVASLKKSFTGPARPESSTLSRRARLNVESLEERQMLASGLPAVPPPYLAPQASAPAATALVQVEAQAPDVQVRYALAASQTLNQKIVGFCNYYKNRRVGGGECAHLATEALRYSGADFIRNGTWGNLVTQMKVQNGRLVDTNPRAAVQPGDIIQFQNVKYSNGGIAVLHTAIVASVDASGRPNAVYEQNVNGTRYVRIDPINLRTMISGTASIYRAVPRVDVAGRVQFALLNNTNSVKSVTVCFNGKAVGTVTLDRCNTVNSYKTVWYQNSARGTWTLFYAGRSYPLSNGIAYQL